MAFVDSYPGGRILVLAPITWGSDGFPTLQAANKKVRLTHTLTRHIQTLLQRVQTLSMVLL